MGAFAPFRALRDRFIRLFHRQIPKRDSLLSQFYAISQEHQETIPQFTIRFQNLHRELAREISADNPKDTFLTTLREPLRTTLGVLDFSQQMIEQVVDQVLVMDNAQNSTSFPMGSLRGAFPTTEETQFWQAIQCTTCLNLGHLVVNCALRPKCSIYHSRTHTVEQCEYNMLNRTAAVSVQQIEPRNDCPRHDDRARPPP